MELFKTFVLFYLPKSALLVGYINLHNYFDVLGITVNVTKYLFNVIGSVHVIPLAVGCRR